MANKSDIFLANNIILKLRTGSQLYGTATPESDEDFIEIGIPKAQYILGMNTVELVDIGEKSKLSSGKNAPDAIDSTIFTLTKFCKLALDGNPNVLELLFVNEQNKVSSTELGEELLSLRDKFISQLIIHRFAGYAFSQRHKMVIKLENYTTLKAGLHALETIDVETEGRFLIEWLQTNSIPEIKDKRDHFSIGDLNIPKNTTIKQAKRYIQQRLEMFGNRKELVSDHGYDVKFAMHYLRLLLECEELMITGNLIFPLKAVDLLKSVRAGEFNIDEVIKFGEYLEKKIEGLKSTTNLPHKPNFKAVNEYVIKTNYKIIKGEMEDGSDTNVY